MSTNKTQNYGLHSWVPEDNFQLSEINENFAHIDALLMGKGRWVTGVYAGDSTPTVEYDLGGEIMFLFLENAKGIRSSTANSMTISGLSPPGHPLQYNGKVAVELDGSKFILHYSLETNINSPNHTYYYLACVKIP